MGFGGLGSLVKSPFPGMCGTGLVRTSNDLRGRVLQRQKEKKIEAQADLIRLVDSAFRAGTKLRKLKVGPETEFEKSIVVELGETDGRQRVGNWVRIQ